MDTKLLLVLGLMLLSGCASQQHSKEAANADSTNSIDAQSLDVDIAEIAEIENLSLEQTLTDEQEFIWQRLTSQFQLVDKESNKNLQAHLRWLTNNQSYINRITERGNLYLYYILGQVEDRELPAELALLPAVESAFNPLAYSRSHAAGLWQFIPATGERFGLKKTWWADERRDVIASTESALDYLEYLHKLFDGDWLLAIAAYNCGEGNVRKAVRRNERQGKPTDFWSLKLPRETRNYVPRLLALSKVVQAPEQYGVSLYAIPNQPHFNIVDIPGQMNLTVAAQMAELEYAELEKLNPAFKRRVTAPEGPHRVLLPVQVTDKFRNTLASTPVSAWKPIEQYVVKKGDSLYKIAKKHHLSINELAQFNGLNSHVLQIGQRLDLPGTGSIPVSTTGLKVYQVKRGDSLWKIANRHGLSAKQLAILNHLPANAMIKPGDKLNLTAETTLETPVKLQKVKYRVKRGDSLSRIASKFYLSINDIMSWNKLSKKSYIHPGQTLTLFVDINKI